ncbi:MAG: bifunctional [glutamine synthetase] adenylyltransferase/[glutamine synthetase]-adenylyl-L-tyrosine phosphorylase [Pseudomonadota bacterium]
MTGSKSLADSIKDIPPVFDGEAASYLIEQSGDAISDMSARAQTLLKAAAGGSPYLRRLATARKDKLQSFFDAPPEESLRAIIARAETAPEHTDEANQMRVLREAKQDAALLIALADLAGVWEVMTATHALSRFADAVIKAALKAAVARSPLESAAGLVILAMGKHGAFELNYSSDVDLVVLFDRARMKCDDPQNGQKYAVAVTRDLVRLLHNQTAQGYVFRTDLRLRPDPGVTAPAVSASAAESYYEAFGQNWERMAFIKARPCAGDMALGENFLQTLRPFIWRKFLDFAAIEDVHAVKRQMHSAKGGSDIAFEGHDLKLGRGGIREIEFYAQTQQLILGGKNAALRVRGTLDALRVLTKAGAMTEDERQRLSAAYRYLRHVEHRLQMVNDEQTHRIPTDALEIERLALFSGSEDSASFRQNLLQTFRDVGEIYDSLFQIEDDPESRLGALVFTGVEPHPATLDTLARLGFQRGLDVSQAIMRWHKGALRATRAERSRALLTKLIPHLLEALSKASDPDDAFFAFEEFLARLPAGVQVFSLLLNNLEIFDALIRIMTISPYLGREFSKRLNLVERLLDNRWSVAPPPRQSYVKDCKKVAGAAFGYEDALNAVRRWAGEQKFQITAQLAVGQLPHQEAAAHFTAIADAAISVLVAHARREMEKQHGRIDGELVTIGLGRLGAGEMTAISDIDLMFIYEAGADAVSDGSRPLGAVDYFTRLVRRSVTALSAATQEGGLYEVDMQLRPSGKAGPAAVSYTAFQRYYRQEAWTWEAMALVKARAIGERGPLFEKISAEVSLILSQPRQASAVAADVAAMRGRLDRAKPGAGVWDVKNIIGGLTDIAFICQYLRLTAGEGAATAPRDVAGSLDWFAKNGELAQNDADVLSRAHALFEAVLQASRAATGGVFSPEKAGEALCVRMASVCGEEMIANAEQKLLRHQEKTASCFASIVGDRRLNISL